MPSPQSSHAAHAIALQRWAQLWDILLSPEPVEVPAAELSIPVDSAQSPIDEPVVETR